MCSMDSYHSWEMRNRVGLNFRATIVIFTGSLDPIQPIF